MEKLISKIVLNVSGRNVFHAISAKQYDNGSRVIQAQITNDGAPIYIRETDTIIANYRRPKYSSDVKDTDYIRAVSGEVVEGENGIVQFPLDYWAVERSGELCVDVSIITACSPPERLTTAAFTITVYPATYYSDESLAGESYDALLDIFRSVDGYRSEITSVVTNVVETSIANETRRESEYSALKIHMEGVVNEAEVSERNAAASLSEVRLAVSDFKEWYDRLPEKGITIGDHFIDFTKLTTFKTTVNVDQTPTEPTHAVNKRYVDNYVPDRAMNAYRLNDTYGSLILYEEAYGIKVQSHAGGNWNDGIYVVSTSKEDNSYSTITCGDAEKRNLVSLVCCAANGTRHIDIVKDGVYHAIEFPFKDGEFALTSDLEPYLLRDGIVNGDGFVDFHKHVTFKSTVNLDVAPVENQQAANKGYVDGVASGKLSNDGILNAEGFVDFNKPVTFKSTVNIDADPIEHQQAANKGYVDGVAAGKLSNDGIVNAESFVDFNKHVTFKSTVNIDTTPTASVHATNKRYVDDKVSSLAQSVAATYLTKAEWNAMDFSGLATVGGTQFITQESDETVDAVYASVSASPPRPYSSNARDGYSDPEVYLNPGNHKLYAYNGVECVDFYKTYDYLSFTASSEYAVLQFYGRFEFRVYIPGGRYSSGYYMTIECYNPVFISRYAYGDYFFDVYYTDLDGLQQKCLYQEDTSRRMDTIEIKRVAELGDDYTAGVMIRFKRLGGSFY